MVPGGQSQSDARIMLQVAKTDKYSPYLVASDYSTIEAKWCQLRNNILGNTEYLFLMVTNNSFGTVFNLIYLVLNE